MSFQGTLSISIHAPRVGRDHIGGICAIYGRISIHAPRVGRDDRCIILYIRHFISIHAPRVGRDDGPTDIMLNTKVFQSTRPVWGATNDKQRHHCKRIYFNPRAPCGARPPTGQRRVLGNAFQSTRPVWDATTFDLLRIALCTISIHAPRVGRDMESPPSVFFHSSFQSTRPVWDATSRASPCS